MKSSKQVGLYSMEWTPMVGTVADAISNLNLECLSDDIILAI